MDRAPGAERESGMRWALRFFGLSGPRQRKLPSVAQTFWLIALGALGLPLMLLTHGFPYYIGVVLFVGCGGTGLGSLLRRWREVRRDSN
jgi:hypothetical protein